MYRGGEYPIYCMTAIKSDNISDGNILINKRIIKDFKCENGFLVLIDFKSFLCRLKFLETNNNPYHHQPIVYGTPTFEVSTKWLCENSLDNLFVKHPFFSYQQEYRIIVLEKLKARKKKKYMMVFLWMLRTMIQAEHTQFPKDYKTSQKYIR